MIEIVSRSLALLPGLWSFWNFLGIAATLLYFFWWRRPHSKFPPGPRGLPLLGVVPFLGNYPFKTYKKWSLEKYGPVLSVKMGVEDVVVLNDYNSIYQALVKKGASFSDRPWIELFARSVGSNGIATKPYGESFKTQKRFGLKYLREQDSGKKFEGIVNGEVDVFISAVQKREKGPIDLHKHFFTIAANVISQICFGMRYDFEDPAYAKLLDALQRMLADPQDAVYINLMQTYGSLAKLPPVSWAAKRSEDRMKIIIDEVQNNIDKHREKFDPENVNDFIDSFLYEQKMSDLDNSFTDSQLRGFCRDMFLGGTDTTSTTVAWLFVIWLNFPQYQEGILQEIEQAFGIDGTPSMVKSSEMPLTFAFIQETFRYRSIAPFGLDHLTSKTCQLMGHIIPKGTKVVPNLYGAHMDPTTWPNPQSFDPNRHINEDGKFISSSKIIPFSVGPRVCIAEGLSRMEVFIIFVKLLQKFKVFPSGEGVPPVNNEIKGVVLAPQRCDVILEPRF